MLRTRYSIWHVGLAALSVCLVVVALAVLGAALLDTGTFGQPTGIVAVQFAPSVSYNQALRIVTDLGLATAVPCLNLDADWVPVANFDDQQWWGEWAIQPSDISAPDWLARLRQTAGVTDITINPIYHCALSFSATRVPGGRYYLTAAQAGALLRVTFTGDTGYADALARIIALGFAFADPCYTHPPMGIAVAWTPMGQEGAYTRTHALLVRTTRLNSTQWRQQMQSETPGVAGLQQAPTVACPAA